MADPARVVALYIGVIALLMRRHPCIAIGARARERFWLLAGLFSFTLGVFLYHVVVGGCSM